LKNKMADPLTAWFFKIRDFVQKIIKSKSVRGESAASKIMDIHQNWEKALKNTEIIRSRVKELMTFSDTQVPYILLSASSINLGDTVVRKGNVKVNKPAIILPPNVPQFYGFEFDREGVFNENTLTNFLMVRGITMPSMKYNNQVYSVDVHEEKLEKAIGSYHNELQRKEDVQTGLLVGPEDCWQFSLLVYICMQVARNTESDIRRLLEKYHNEESS